VSGLTPRSRFLRALGRETGEYLPLSVQFAPTKLEEFRSANGGADPYEFFDLDYRHVGVPAPNSLPDFHRYFEGRVPDWTDYTDAGLDLVPFRGSSYYSMGPGGTAMNEWGEYRIYEKSGDYHKKIYPLAGENTRMADIEAYPMPDYHAQSRYDGVADSIRKVRGQGLAAVLSWEMTIFEKAWRIRGLEDLMMDFMLHPDLAECLMDRISAQTGKLAAEYGRLGIDVIQLGDDIGSQNGMMISPEIYREFLKPRMEKLVGDIRRANPDTLVFYHSDGDVSPVIGDFVDVGIDILNPVQRECMDIASIKKRYGDNLSFWGGLSVQRALPFGSPAEVAAETREIARVAGKGGGLVIAPGHLVERDIPLENVYVFAETVRKINGEAV
jgi:uroporphyrinogen decarboxylase